MTMRISLAVSFPAKAASLWADRQDEDSQAQGVPRRTVAQVAERFLITEMTFDNWIGSAYGPYEPWSTHQRLPARAEKLSC